MTKEDFYRSLQSSFEAVLKQHGVGDEAVEVTCRTLSPEEAIGTPVRRDFPILTGKDVMIQARFRSSLGQAFTEAPLTFQGSLSEVLAADLAGDPHARGLYIAVLNAAAKELGLCGDTVHCRTQGPELCAGDMLSYLRTHYPDKRRVALVGYQPALLEMLSKSEYGVRVLDLNPANVGQIRFGVTVEDGIRDYRSAVLEYADLVLCTGSTICNGTITDYLDLPVEVVFFGTTISGAAALLGLKRACFADRYA